MHTLSVQNLTRRNPASPKLLLDSVSFELKSGDRVALHGKSGSGKTLLLRAVVGLDPIDAGSILFDGRNRTADWICAFRTYVAYVPQKCALFPGTVHHNLERAKQLRTRRTNTEEFNHIEALDATGFPSELIKRDVQMLSGGELQLVNLLRTLQFAPPFLLLDEPTAAMDATTTALVEKWLLAWQAADRQRAWVWISHDAKQCERVSNAKWLMDQGQLS